MLLLEHYGEFFMFSAYKVWPKVHKHRWKFSCWHEWPLEQVHVWFPSVQAHKHSHRLHKYWSYERESWGSALWLPKCVASRQAQDGHILPEESVLRQEIHCNIQTELKTKDACSAIFWHVLTTKTSCCATPNSSDILVTYHLFCLSLLLVTWLCSPHNNFDKFPEEFFLVVQTSMWFFWVLPEPKTFSESFF